MRIMWRQVSALGFVAAGASFWLPFLTRRDDFQHGALELAWSGLDLTVGGTLTGRLVFDGGPVVAQTPAQLQLLLTGLPPATPPDVFLPAQPSAMIAILLVLTGALTLLLSDDGRPAQKQRAVWAAGAGLLGALLLAVAEWRAVAAGPVEGMAPAVGFWVACALLTLVGVSNLIVATGKAWVPRALVPAGFVLAGLCLALPFSHVRPESTELVRTELSWAGWDEVFGGDADMSIHQPGPVAGGDAAGLGERDYRLSDAEARRLLVFASGGEEQAHSLVYLPRHWAGWAAVVLLAAGALSALASTVESRRRYAALAAGGALLLLAWAQWETSRRAALAPPETGWGFWATVAVLAALAGVSGLGVYRERGNVR